MASAMVEPVLSERMARPTRESNRLVTPTAQTRATAQISPCNPRPEPRSTPNRFSEGMPLMPSYLPRNAILAMV